MKIFGEETFNLGNPRDKDVKLDIKSVTLNKAAANDYTLDITYRVETPSEIKEIRFPVVQLPLYTDEIPVSIIRDCYCRHAVAEVNIGFGKTTAYGDHNGNAYYEKIIKTKTKEMTLDEIEKKLGHKVKIVNG